MRILTKAKLEGQRLRFLGLLVLLEVNIDLRSIFARQARFVATAAISLVSRVLLVFGTEEDLIPLDILEVVVDFAIRLLRGKQSTQVVLEISLQHPRVVIFASNRVIFIVLVHGNQGKTIAGSVLSVIPLISVLFISWLRRNLRRMLWHTLLFVLKLLVPCRNLFQESCTFSLAR